MGVGVAGVHALCRHVDVGVISHWHVDHLGYAGYGGFWCLIERELLTFGKIVDRDGGVFTSGTECNEETIQWKNVGTVSGTAVSVASRSLAWAHLSASTRPRGRVDVSRCTHGCVARVRAFPVISGELGLLLLRRQLEDS